MPLLLHTLASQAWPCPAPYPEVFVRGARGPRGWRKVQVCLIVLLLSWLHLGCPSQCPATCALGTKLSAKQWQAVRTIEGLAWDCDFSVPIDAAEMGRAASKVEDQDRVLAALSRAAAAFSSPGCTQVSSATFKAPRAAGAKLSSSVESASFGKIVGSSVPTS